MATVQKIKANLWFDKEAEDAAKFYTSIFKNSAILSTTHYGKEGYEIHKMPEGTVMTVEFELDGQKFVALNGGPAFRFNESVSFIISCVDQEEIDYYWDKLGDGGDPKSQQCGWLKDKFGLSWQVVPAALSRLIADPERARRVLPVLWEMKKLDLKKLEEA